MSVFMLGSKFFKLQFNFDFSFVSDYMYDADKY